MTILSTPALRDYEQLILFVKPFCAFLFKMYKTIGFSLISYKRIIQILQTISSVISSLYSGFVMYSAPVKAFLVSFGFTESFSAAQKTHVGTGVVSEPFYAKSECSFLKNKSYMSA